MTIFQYKESQLTILSKFIELILISLKFYVGAYLISSWMNNQAYKSQYLFVHQHYYNMYISYMNESGFPWSKGQSIIKVSKEWIHPDEKVWRFLGHSNSCWWYMDDLKKKLFGFDCPSANPQQSIPHQKFLLKDPSSTSIQKLSKSIFSNMCKDNLWTVYWTFFIGGQWIMVELPFLIFWRQYFWVQPNRRITLDQ